VAFECPFSEVSLHSN